MKILRHELIDQLRQITDEEKDLLADGGQVKKNIYTSETDFTVDSKKMLDDGRLISVRTHTRFVAFPRHRHNYIEIVYMCSGSTTHIVSGRDRIVLETGDLLFLNQHCEHEILPAGENDIGINFIILPEFFHQAFDMMEDENILSNFIISALTRDTGSSGYLHFEARDLLPVQNLVENMVWMLLNRPGRCERLSRVTMGLLFLQLLENTETITCAQPDQFGHMTALAALRYIEEHFRDASLSALARQLGQPISGLSRVIKSETGVTFSRLLLTKRFERALDLLCNTRMPLTDIITAVGYENTSYFYRVFRREYGVSPAEYRARRRAAGASGAPPLDPAAF